MVTHILKHIESYDHLEQQYTLPISFPKRKESALVVHCPLGGSLINFTDASLEISKETFKRF